MIGAGTGADIPEEERVANEAAAEFCVPQKQLKQFIQVKSPFFAERDIRGFAATYKIYPGHSCWSIAVQDEAVMICFAII